MASESLQVRRRPTRARPGNPQRDSNVVRASVLETALELGFGQNSTVADWIFNNPLSEEAEDPEPELEPELEPGNQVQLDTKPEPVPYIAEVTTPTFTSGSNSTSDESSSLNSPGNTAPNAAITTIQVHSHKTDPPHVHFSDFSWDQLQLFSPFMLSPRDAHHVGTRGNFVGELPADTERSRSQDHSLRRNPSPGAADSGYTSEGQYLSKGNTSKKDKSRKPKGNKGLKSKTLDTSKTSEADGDYASDGGYLSASSNKSQGKLPGGVKSRAMAFFRRRPKRSSRGSDDEDEDSVPPVPAIPVLPRPSSPKPLERRVAPSSPTRSGFAPLALNLTSPPASSLKHRVSKSPPPIHARATPPQQSDRFCVSPGPASPPVASPSTPTILTPTSTAATVPLPTSMPGTPLSTASFPVSPPSTQTAAGTSKFPATPSSRQHLSIPPPTPPPTLPLPQPPPSPSTSPGGRLSHSPATPIIPSRKAAPTRSIPVVPANAGSTRPLTPRRTVSPFRPLLSPRTSPPTGSHARAREFLSPYEGDQPDGRGAIRKQRFGIAVPTGSTPAFLQRKIQHGPPPSPRHPPPDIPLPPSPCPTPSTRPRTPIGTSSKFHEHFSSVSSVPSSQFLSTAKSVTPSLSTAALSESSSGYSIRSSHVSLASGRSEEPSIPDLANITEYSRPTTRTSTISESSYGQPIPSTFALPVMGLNSRSSDWGDISSSVYSPTMHRASDSITAFDDDDADVDYAAPKSYVDEDDDASIYTSDDKTAGRRTMYLLEHGELDENGDEIVIAGSHYWGTHEAPPPLPPLPSLPPMLTRPGPGYF